MANTVTEKRKKYSRTAILAKIYETNFSVNVK